MALNGWALGRGALTRPPSRLIRRLDRREVRHQRQRQIQCEPVRSTCMAAPRRLQYRHFRNSPTIRDIAATRSDIGKA